MTLSGFNFDKEWQLNRKYFVEIVDHPEILSLHTNQLKAHSEKCQIKKLDCLERKSDLIASTITAQIEFPKMNTRDLTPYSASGNY